MSQAVKMRYLIYTVEKSFKNSQIRMQNEMTSKI